MNEIFELNKAKYHDDSEVAYMKEDYHVMRINIAIDLLEEEVHKLTDKSNAKLLSLGCSTGMAEKEIIGRTGLKVYGLEGSEECAQIAAENGLIMEVGDVTKKLPYADNSFEFVFAGEVIEHVMEIRSFLSEIKRVLKPSGYLIITTPNLARVDDRIKFIFGIAPRHTSPIHEYLYLHIRPFTYGSLQETLNKMGFVIKSFKSNYIAFDVWGKRYINRFLAKIFPSLGGTLIVKAQVNK